MCHILLIYMTFWLVFALISLKTDALQVFILFQV